MLRLACNHHCLLPRIHRPPETERHWALEIVAVVVVPIAQHVVYQHLCSVLYIRCACSTGENNEDQQGEKTLPTLPQGQSGPVCLQGSTANRRRRARRFTPSRTARIVKPGDNKCQPRCAESEPSYTAGGSAKVQPLGKQSGNSLNHETWCSQ